MDVMTKRLQQVEFKAGDQGAVSAIFSRFGVIDADGDVTLAGAFEDGAEVPISAYGHTSWQGALPVGKGVIRADSQVATISAQFFMGTASGRDTFEVVKQLGALGQWSYGYRIELEDTEVIDGRRVRILKKLAVDEVSPVLVGAGVRTMTLDAKDADLLDIRAQQEVLRIVQDWQTRQELRAIRQRSGVA